MEERNILIVLKISVCDMQPLTEMIRTSQEKVDFFTSGTGDYNEIHNEKVFWEKSLDQNTPFKKPIIPGLYELFIVELLANRITQKKVSSIDAKFTRAVDIGNDLWLRTTSPYVSYECFTLRNGKEKTCLECTLGYDEDFGVEGYPGFRNEEKKNVGEKEAMLALKSADIHDMNKLPRMFYAASLISDALLKGEKPKAEGFAVYRSIMIQFNESIEKSFPGQYTTKVSPAEIIIGDRNIPIYRYRIVSFGDGGRVVLKARADLSVI
jgi:hypothetical protein